MLLTKSGLDGTKQGCFSLLDLAGLPIMLGLL